MSFYKIYKEYDAFKYEDFFKNVTDSDVLRAINRSKLSILDYLVLLSPKAGNYLEEMARKAHNLTKQFFGKTMILYTPMYLANFCVNRCQYCGFNVDNNISRRKLTIKEIEIEAKAISQTGLRHILLLTGESKKATPVEYIIDAVEAIKKYFDSISIEIYPLEEKDYVKVVNAGVDGLTVYQEVYNEKIYDRVHLSGPKKNYNFRLDAPERACKAKMRTVNIGALLGLDKWQKEAFYTGLHAKYLQDKYNDVDISVSLPRIRPHIGVFEDVKPVSDPELVQIMMATRIFLPRVGITVSTREKEEFRNNILPLGVTKMSAGVSTEVGGHSSQNKSESQFEISDKRSVNEIRQMLISKNYQPVFKDWMLI
ncbi:MAG: 2-iminoacetate synthase ThiH [Eubacteriales bacterium]